MIAKGLDFPNVTLVGVVDADTGLYLPDFRSAERTFQLLAQVAGRAGRGPKGGRVIVQTYRPEHHAVRHAAAHDTVGFTKEEIALRQSPPYPPTLSLANLLVSGPNENAVATAAAETADWCRGLIEKYELPIAVLGPAPSPIARIKNRWRWHVVLRGPSDAIGRVTRYAAGRITSGSEPRIVVDRDPGSML
jgi:primosomal protein N' (replication factor Y)